MNSIIKHTIILGFPLSVTLCVCQWIVNLLFLAIRIRQPLKRQQQKFLLIENRKKERNEPTKERN